MKFVGIKWHNQRKKPYLEFKKPETTKSDYFEIIPNAEISLSISPRKTCIGYYSDPDYLCLDCPSDSSFLTSKIQCPSCYQQDSALFLPLHMLNERQKDRILSQPHSTYINLFGPDLIKIGVAAEIRKITRVLEQGAHSTLFISHSDGVVARKIEEYLSTQLRLPQMVQSSTKLGLINNHKPPEEAQKLLETIFHEICRILPEEFQPYLSRPPEFHHNLPYYASANIPDNASCQNILDIDKPAVISGKVLSTFGEFLFIRDVFHRIFGLNTKIIKGFESRATLGLSENTYTKFRTKTIKLVSPDRNLSLF